MATGFIDGLMWASTDPELLGGKERMKEGIPSYRPP